MLDKQPQPFRSTPVTALLLLAVVYGVFDQVSYHGPWALKAALTVLLGAAILGVAAFELRGGLLLFILAVVFSDDISRLDPTGGYETLVNLVTMSWGGVAAANLVALGLMTIAGFYMGFLLLRGLLTFRLNAMDAVMLGVALLYLAATMHGWRSLVDNPRGALNDLNLPLMVCGMYGVTRAAITREHDSLTLFRVLILATAAKAMVWLGFALAGVGVAFGLTLRVGYDSGSTLFILLVAYGLLLQRSESGVDKKTRWTGLAIAAIAGGLILITAGRMNWVFTGLTILLLLFLNNWRDTLRWLAPGAVAGAVVLLILLRALPNMMLTITGLASTLMFWQPHNLENSPSTIVRAYEFTNIHAQLKENGHLLFGDGPGAVFTDRYAPMPIALTDSDYPHDQVMNRTYQNTHSLVSNLILNTGYVGMVFYIMLMVAAFGVLWKGATGHHRSARSDPTDGSHKIYPPEPGTRNPEPALTTMGLALLAFLPVMVYMSWSAKTYMLLGVIFGLAGSLCSRGGARDA